MYAHQGFSITQHTRAENSKSKYLRICIVFENKCNHSADLRESGQIYIWTTIVLWIHVKNAETITRFIFVCNPNLPSNWFSLRRNRRLIDRSLIKKHCFKYCHVFIVINLVLTSLYCAYFEIIANQSFGTIFMFFNAILFNRSSNTYCFDFRYTFFFLNFSILNIYRSVWPCDYLPYLVKLCKLFR